jgi:hypothetical protein
MKICSLLTIALIGFAHSFTHAAMEEFSTAKVLGKAEDYARGEFEFRLPSSQIRAYSLSDFSSFEYVLLIGTDSERCRNADILDSIDKLRRRLTKKYNNKLKVVVVDAGINVQRSRISDIVSSRWPGDSKLDPVYLFDSVQLVSSSFLFKHSGDFVLINPTDASILISGGLKDLDTDIIERAISGRATVRTQTGTEKHDAKEYCEIEFWHQDDLEASFSNRFVIPFQKTCLNCHAQSDSFDIFASLDAVLGWRAMSLKTIKLMRMPGLHEPHFSGSLPHEATGLDLIKVVNWLSEPGIISPSDREVFQKAYEESRSKIKKNLNQFRSDYKLEKSAPFKVSAASTATYYRIKLGVPTDSEIAIKAIRLSTNLNAVHHANLYAVDPKLLKDRNAPSNLMVSTGVESPSWRTERPSLNQLKQSVTGTLNSKPHSFNILEEPIIATYSRRAGVARLKPGVAYRVPKGSQFVVDLHLEPSGKDELVTTEFEFELVPQSETYRPVSRLRISPGPEFKIPINSPSYIAKGSFRTHRAIHIQSAWFHSHYRAIGSRIWIRSPDGKLVDILNNPFKQLKMQQSREFKPPGLFVAKDSEINFAIEYDNSKRNAANPDPNVPVKIGGSLFDHEMHHPRIVYVEAD